MEKEFEDLARRVEELDSEQIKLAEAQAEQKVVFGRFDELQARLERLEKLPDQVRHGDGKAEHGLNQVQGQVDGLRGRVKELERLEREVDKGYAELKRRVKEAERAAILAKETAKEAEQKMESLYNVVFPFGDESDTGLERRRREALKRANRDWVNRLGLGEELPDEKEEESPPDCEDGFVVTNPPGLIPAPRCLVNDCDTDVEDPCALGVNLKECPEFNELCDRVEGLEKRAGKLDGEPPHFPGPRGFTVEERLNHLENLAVATTAKVDAGLERLSALERRAADREQAILRHAEAVQRWNQHCPKCDSRGPGHYPGCPTQREDEQPPGEEPAEEGGSNLELLKRCLDHIRMSFTYTRYEPPHLEEHLEKSQELGIPLRKAIGGGSFDSFIASACEEMCDREMAQEAARRLSDPEATSMPFAEVRQRMARELRRDEGLRIGYVANVAMMLHDRYGITDHATRNQAAEAILDLIFEDERPSAPLSPVQVDMAEQPETEVTATAPVKCLCGSEVWTNEGAVFWGKAGAPVAEWKCAKCGTKAVEQEFCSIGTVVDKSQATELSPTSNMPPAEFVWNDTEE